MEPKKKLCFGCNTLQYIWKNHEGKKYCKECSFKLEKPKVFAPRVAVKKISDKRAKENAIYKVSHDLFLKTNPRCQLQFAGCTHQATEVHHTYYGADRDKYFLDITTWKAGCRNCHSFGHDKLSAEEAREIGFKK